MKNKCKTCGHNTGIFGTGDDGVRKQIGCTEVTCGLSDEEKKKLESVWPSITEPTKNPTNESEAKAKVFRGV